MTDNINLTELIANGALLVDVRRPDEFAEGNAPGSINIQHDTIQNHVKKLKDATQIIVFCRSGARAGFAKSTLEGLGFTNVTNGGTWQDVLAYVKA